MQTDFKVFSSFSSIAKVVSPHLSSRGGRTPCEFGSSPFGRGAGTAASGDAGAGAGVGGRFSFASSHLHYFL